MSEIWLTVPISYADNKTLMNENRHLSFESI